MKKQTFTLKLKKAKIVNLTILSRVDGGTGVQSDPQDPDATCGDCTSINCTDMTDDKTNTNNSIFTMMLSCQCI